jgi:hypothetical protein
MARRNSADPVQRSHRQEGQQGPRGSLESPCAARHAIPPDGIVTGASQRPAKSSVHRTLAGLPRFKLTTGLAFRQRNGTRDLRNLG